MFGEHCFGIDNFQDDPLSNRNLLFEFCVETGLQVTNTYYELADDQLVTYRNLGVKPFSDVIFPNFAQLDYVLMPEEWRHVVSQLSSTRNAQLHSQHFLLFGIFDVEVAKDERGYKS